MRPEQPTVPDPDPRTAMAALLASTQSQEQAAAVLREAGWTVYAKGEVYWVTEQLDEHEATHFACRDGSVLGSIDFVNSIVGPHWTSDVAGIRVTHDTEADARAAVEAALKGGAK
jgi:hypothetical protein